MSQNDPKRQIRISLTASEKINDVRANYVNERDLNAGEPLKS